MEILKVLGSFSGGISSNTKSGIPGSGRFMRNLDIFTDSDSVSPNQKGTLNSSTNVVGLIKWIVDAAPYTGDLWGYDNGGNLYRSDRTFWNLERSGGTIGHGAAGQGLIVFQNALYYPTSNTIGRGEPLNLGSGSIVWDDDFIHTLGLDIDNFQVASTQTYTTPATIIEDAANSLFFVPTHDPITTFSIIFGTKGTGHVTVTIHDVDNNIVAIKGVDSIDLPASGAYDFTFDTPWTPMPLGDTYHIHVTSTVADATLQTGTADNLSTVNYTLYFGVLLSNEDFHPVIQHTNGVSGTIVIGNNNYMAVWDGGTYNPNKIAIAPGFSIRGWARENEYIVAYCWKVDDVDLAEEGQLFYWDGIAPYYNFSKPINLGMPNAIISSKNRLFSVLGQEGNFTLGTDPFRTIQPAPKLPRAKKIACLPGAITTWQNKVHIGISSPDSDVFEDGIYVFGNQSDKALSVNSVSTEVINYGYQLSTGATTDTQIGAAFGAGNDFFFSWRDGITYGVDKVSKDNDAAPTFSWESLIIDDGLQGNSVTSMPQKEKEGIKITITFLPLTAGVTIAAKYKLDRAASFTVGTAAGTGETTATTWISHRYREIEVGFDGTSTGDFPTITGVVLTYNPLEKERMEAQQ